MMRPFIKATLLTVFSILLFHSSVVRSQSFCATSGNYPNVLQGSGSARQVAYSVAANTVYRLRVYIHIMRRSDGTGGQTNSEADAAIRVLQNDFSRFNIDIEVLGRREIRNTAFYNTSNFVSDCNGDGIIDNQNDRSDCNGDGKFDNFQPNSHRNAIDIYLFANNGNLRGGLAANIPGTALVIGGNLFGTNLASSHVLSHELGHCLGLFHTFHGLCEDGGCRELVNGSNGLTCGDFVEDTRADPQEFSVASNCRWDGSTCGISNRDANGQQYRPDVTNIMAYTRPSCMSSFTRGQRERVRAVIANSAILQQVVYTPPPPRLSFLDRLCPNNSETLRISNVPPGVTVTWSSSSNVRIVSSSNSRATIRAANSRSSGSGWIRATLSNSTVLMETFEVIRAPSSPPTLSSLDHLCNSSRETLTLSNVPACATVTWASSGNVSHTPSPDRASVTIRPASPTSQGQGSVTATLSNGTTITETFTVYPMPVLSSIDGIYPGQPETLYIRNYSSACFGGQVSWRATSYNLRIISSGSNYITIENNFVAPYNEPGYVKANLGGITLTSNFEVYAVFLTRSDRLALVEELCGFDPVTVEIPNPTGATVASWEVPNHMNVHTDGHRATISLSRQRVGPGRGYVTARLSNGVAFTMRFPTLTRPLSHEDLSVTFSKVSSNQEAQTTEGRYCFDGSSAYTYTLSTSSRSGQWSYNHAYQMRILSLNHEAAYTYSGWLGSPVDMPSRMANGNYTFQVRLKLSGGGCDYTNWVSLEGIKYGGCPRQSRHPPGKRFTIYPNPSSGVVHVSTRQGATDVPRRYVVYKASPLTRISEGSRFPININRRGVYLLEIHGEGYWHEYHEVIIQ